MVSQPNLVLVPHHAADNVAGRRLVGPLQDALQQEGIFGESLVRLGQHVGQLQTVALLMCLCPLNGAKQRQEVKHQRRGGARGSRQGEWRGNTHRHVRPEELVVPEKCAHVLHAALLLHAVTDVGLEPGAKLSPQRHTSVRNTTWTNTVLVLFQLTVLKPS